MATTSPAAVAKRAIPMPPASWSALPIACEMATTLKHWIMPITVPKSPDQRRDLGHGIEHAEVAAKMAHLPFSAVDDRLFDFDARLAPFANAVGEDERDRAAVLFA